MNEIYEALERLQKACQRLDEVTIECERKVDLAMAKCSSIDEPRILELQHQAGVNESADGGDE